MGKYWICFAKIFSLWAPKQNWPIENLMFAYNNFLHNRNNNNGHSDNVNDNTKGYVNVLLMLTTTTGCELRAEHKNPKAKNTSKNKGELENETQNKPQRQDDRRIRRRRSLDGKPRGQLNRYTERINETKPIPRGDTLPEFAFGFHLAPVIAPASIASIHTSPNLPNRSASPRMSCGNVWGMSVVVTISITIRITKRRQPRDIGFFFVFSVGGAEVVSG